MAQQIALERLITELFDLFEETFEKVHGAYLDRGTSLFETLETISSEEASRPVSATCATIAAQVEHVSFYLDVLQGHMTNNPPGKVDWGEIWRTVHEVSPEEWEASKQRLQASYQRLQTLMRGFDTWEGENDISGALVTLIHTAYHLGEIRQATCTIKEAKA